MADISIDLEVIKQTDLEAHETSDGYVEFRTKDGRIVSSMPLSAYIDLLAWGVEDGE